MTDRFKVASSLFRRLDHAGIDSAQVLGRAGLPLSLLEQDRISLTTEELFSLYRSISALSPDPGAGLRIAAEDRIEQYDPVVIAALCTRSLRDALERLARYKQLTCPEEISISETEEECHVRFIWLLAGEPEPAFLIDCCFAWIASVVRRATAGQVKFRRVELARPADYAPIYQQHFQCPVVTGAPHNLIVFRRADLDKPFLTYNADLLATVAPQLEAELNERLAGHTIAEQVQTVLKRIMAGQRPDLGNVASHLRLSTRTLQRRLREESVTFQDLVKEVRRRLARHYLLHARLELSETAYLLGYEDANSFFRAFHEWEGMSPGEWRASRLVEPA